jgi:hypothetical protein
LWRRITKRRNSNSHLINDCVLEKSKLLKAAVAFYTIEKIINKSVFSFLKRLMVAESVFWYLKTTDGDCTVFDRGKIISSLKDATEVQNTNFYFDCLQR